jgi:hypothetical protein
MSPERPTMMSVVREQSGTCSRPRALQGGGTGRAGASHRVATIAAPASRRPLCLLLGLVVPSVLMTSGQSKTTPPRADGRSASSDRDDGPAAALLVTVFAAASVMVVTLVAMIAMVRTWWMFGVTFAIEVVVTAIVVGTIIGVMSGRARRR